MSKKENINKILPRISIIAVSYNQGEFLEGMINSVLSQNYPNLEFIIIDGGSDDNSIEIIRKYEQDLTYWISEKDNGPEYAFDKGFARATGDIYGILNSDDLLINGSLHIAARTIVEYDVDLVYGDGLHIDKNGHIISYRILPDMHPHSFLLYGSGCLHATGTYWTCKLHQQVDRKMNTLCESGGAFDIAWFLRMTGLPNLKYKYLRIPLTFVRAYSGQRHSLLPKSKIGRERADYIREKGISHWKLLIGGIYYGIKRRIHNTNMQRRSKLGKLFHMPKWETWKYIINVGRKWE